MKKRFVIFAALLVSAMSVRAQQFPYVYSLSHFSAPYTPLSSNAVMLSSTSPWGQMDLFGFHLPFSFNVLGTPVDSVYVFPSIGITFNSPLYACFHVFQGCGIVDRTSSLTSASPLRYEITGTPGNRIVKIEMDSAGFIGDYWDTGNFNSYISYQVWLSEADSSIELHMGNTYVTNPGGTFTNNQGPNIGILHWNSQYAYDYGYYASGLLATVSGSYSNNPDFFSLPYITGVPSLGRVYRFEPTTLGVGMHEDAQTNVAPEVFPNPVTDQLTLRWINVPGQSSGDVTICNALGETLLTVPADKKQSTLLPGLLTIGTADLPAGAYYVRLGNSKAARFIKL